ncbi:SRPBCC family protein [Demequina aurantiaca]|uniref:SRPBCC family protein n=1 Tax=Demequina aurantiaca TaxID=676200 RepID=UPI003D33408A
MPDTDHVRIERSFAAPIDLIWAMWTQPDHFSAWYGPAGAAIPRAAMDVRVGGSRSIDMTMDSPGGVMEMHFVGQYLEVEPRSRLVYTEAKANSAGVALTAEQMGLPAETPMETSVVVDLTDAGGRTLMVVTHVGVPADSPGAQGWGAALDKMEAHAADLVRGQ